VSDEQERRDATVRPPAATATASMPEPRIEVFDGLRLAVFGILASVGLGAASLVEACWAWKLGVGVAAFFLAALVLRFDPLRGWAMRFAGWVIRGHQRSPS
jgi:hypothetical protein